MCQCSGLVILTVSFCSHHREITAGVLQGISFECEIDGRHANGSLELCCCLKTFETVLARGILVLDCFFCRFENQLEVKECRRRFCVDRGPAWLVDDRNILQLEHNCLAVLAERDSARRNWRDPVKTFRRNRRMKIMNLVGWDRRSLENGKSSMREYRLLRLPRRPIFSCHVAVIGCCRTPSEPIALVVCAHSVEAVTTAQVSFEMVDA